MRLVISQIQFKILDVALDQTIMLYNHTAIYIFLYIAIRYVMYIY